MNPIVTHIGTACCLIEIAGYKILTDPVLDKAGKYYHHGFGAISKKISDPKIDPEKLKNIDLILLSHSQHKDNFDTKGRALAKTVPLILSTKRIERKFKQGKGLKAWDEHTIKLLNNIKLKITATPAQHHPSWLPQFISGEVIGFMLEHSETKECLYISGDTIFFDGIKKVSGKFPSIKYALIHVGSAEIRYLTGFGKYTMAAKGFIKTVKQINPQLAIPIHNDGWSHFGENDEGIKKAMLQEENDFHKKVFFLEKGIRTKLMDFIDYNKYKS